MESKPYPGLRRIEDALQLIKSRDPLNYSRIKNNLDYVWVDLLPSALAHYDRSLNACVFDERHVAKETTTVEWMASTIVHEVTHARLEGWGIEYDEKDRSRIEAICLRREQSFRAKLPDGALLQEEIARSLEWYAGNHDYFSDAGFQDRDERGRIETLHHLNAPRWLIRLAMRIVLRRRRWRYRKSENKPLTIT
jgi:hypothetical protein